MVYIIGVFMDFKTFQVYSSSGKYVIINGCALFQNFSSL